MYVYIIKKKCVYNICPPTVSSSRAIFSISCFLKPGPLEETMKKKKNVLNVIFGMSWIIREKSGERSIELKY